MIYCYECGTLGPGVPGCLNIQQQLKNCEKVILLLLQTQQEENIW
jgi:predicted Ser/Thr protein kinase